MTKPIAASGAQPEPAARGPIDAEQARALIFPLYDSRKLVTGETMAAHAAGLARIARSVREDADLQTAAYLFAAHDVLRDADDWIRARAGAPVANLVGDLRLLTRLSESVRARQRGEGRGDGDAPEAQAEALRRMLLAMVNDPRVVVLRLASRLQTLRFLVEDEAAPHPEAPAIARETAALLAPLANRLGVWQLKWELEDLAFRLLEPQTYRDLSGQLEQSRQDRERTIERTASRLRELLASAGIQAEVSGRPKHIVSIHRKMAAKRLALDDVHDLLALRVIVADVSACYEVLSIVHSNWRSVESEYDDYIARPKPNGYRSLHTVVRDGTGRPIEIQIRTQRMHDEAELGVAAHWRYKEGRPQAQHGQQGDSSHEERIAWLRRLFDWSRDTGAGAGGPGAHEGDDGGLPSGVARRVYAMTPQGRVLELPEGATPIDFAYHLHTELGHRCRGARVDGVLASLNTPLQTGQTVEIVAARSGGPSRDWLNPELGFLASARSRNKVRQWFNAIEHEQSVGAGRELLNRELQRLGRTAVNLEELAARLGCRSVDELCLAIWREELGPRAIEHALAGPATDAQAAEAAQPLPAPPSRAAGAAGAPAKGNVLVVGVDSLMTNLARCCRPLPPDEIVGFVTRGRGVSVHRASCVNGRALAQRNPERIIEVTWGKGGAAYPTEIYVLAQDRPGLLRDISEVFAREKFNVLGVSTLSQRGEAKMQFTVQVPDAESTRRTLAQVQEVKGVLVARRR